MTLLLHAGIGIGVITVVYMVLGNAVSRVMSYGNLITGLQVIVFSPVTGRLMPIVMSLGVEILVAGAVLFLTGHRRFARKKGYWKSPAAYRWWSRLFPPRPVPRPAAPFNPYVR